MRALVLFLVLLGPASPAAEKGEISRAEFTARRHQLLSLLDSGAALVIKAAPLRIRNDDDEYPYRQESSFLYLTGVSSIDAFLIEDPRGVPVGSGRYQSVLCIPPRDSAAASAFACDAGDTVVPTATFRALFDTAVSGVKTLYTDWTDQPFERDWLNDKPLFIERDARKEFEAHHPGVQLKNPGPLLGRLREIKSSAEIGLIRRAIDVTETGLRRAMKILRPGVFEYELQAEIEYAMKRGGAEATSFPSIIGSGPNSLILHYSENRRQVKTGDVVVMDVGAEVHGYAADITRTVPAGGRFTPPQKKVYTIVLSAQDSAIAAARPGLTLRDLDGIARGIITRAGFGKYFVHFLSHHVGVDVHDLAASDTLRPGMIITIEPGIYVPANATDVPKGCSGFGVRIEDDILITPNGCELLTGALPRSVAKIETLLRK